jgi:hypothetical protein
VLPDDTTASAAVEDQGDLDPQLVALLCTLYAEYIAGKQLCSLPKLCKRLRVRMSTLQRDLTRLDGADVVLIESSASGAPAVGLTETGRMVAEALSTR